MDEIAEGAAKTGRRHRRGGDTVESPITESGYPKASTPRRPRHNCAPAWRCFELLSWRHLPGLSKRVTSLLHSNDGCDPGSAVYADKAWES
jgi:hypothetical protein